MTPSTTDPATPAASHPRTAPGGFYLVLRLHHPREDALGWHIPPLNRTPA
jgi:hypothetical protein